jgi:6-phosphogluconolactonase (cycloisomerase 2 family)
MAEMIDRLTIAMTEKILGYVSSSYKEIGNRTYVFVIDDVKVLLVNNGSSLQFRASFNGDHSLSKANEWNEMKRFTRCYVESDGSIVLEADYSFEGGVTLENVANFFGLFKASLQAFCAEVL